MFDRESFEAALLLEEVLVALLYERGVDPPLPVVRVDAAATRVGSLAAVKHVPKREGDLKKETKTNKIGKIEACIEYFQRGNEHVLYMKVYLLPIKRICFYIIIAVVAICNYQN